MAETDVGAGNTPTIDRRTRRRVLVSLGGGMTVEWYDFIVYGLMASFIGPHFFPAHDPVASTLSALVVFAIGFGARPLSAVLFAPFADSIGHRRVLIWSIGAMSVATIAIGVLPTYETAGALAGVLLVLCRLVQGMSAGVETPVASAAAVELAEPGKTGRFAGFVTGSFSQFGVLLASLVAFFCSFVLGSEAMAAWGWRVPFIIGGVFSVVIVFLRRTLPETGGSHSVENEGVRPAKSDVWSSLFENRLALLAIIFVVGGTQLGNYLWTVGLPNLAQSVYEEDATAIFAVATGLSVLLTLAGPIVGAIADRYRASRVFVITRLTLAAAVFLPLVYLEPSIVTFAILMIGGGVVVAVNQSFFNYITATLMPARSRSTGIAIGYGVGVALFGGTAPYLLIFFKQIGGQWVFSVYGAVIAVVSVAVYWLAKKRGGLFVGA